MLRYAILTLVMDRELSGYDLSKLLDATTTYVWPAGQNQIYPELQKLQAEGLISGVDVEQPERRPAKRLFRTTPAGREAVDRWIASPLTLTTFRDGFQLRVFNFGRVPAEVSLGLLDQQEALLRERLAIFETIAAGLDATEIPGDEDGWRIGVQAGILTHRAYLEWCDWARQRIRARG